MTAKTKQDGFSVAEVLIAVGILGVAMIFVAGIFPVGLRFAQISIDRTTAAIAAGEAFSKIRLYSERIPDVNGQLTGFLFDRQRDFNDWFTDRTNDYYVDVNTYSYPTDNAIDFDNKKYCWSALLRRTDEFLSDPNKPVSSRDIQVTVFICSRQSPTVRYYQPDVRDSAFGSTDYGRITDEVRRLPKPVRVEIQQVLFRDNELEIQNTNTNNNKEYYLINNGDLIVDDPTGRIYRVIERYAAIDDDTILLDRDFIWDDWKGDPIIGKRYVWVVPPPAAPGKAISPNLNFKGRNPCVAVYQKVIRF
jgi:Tfp pilus assembly protein PilV